MRRTGLLAAALLALAVASPAPAVGQGRLTEVAETVQLPASAGDTVVASCPRGEDVISGGFRVMPRDPFASTLVHESRRQSRSKWRVGFINLHPSSGGSVTTYAYCSPNAPKLSEETRVETIPRNPGSQPRRTVVAGCDRGSHAVSGGFGTELLATANGLLLQSSRRIGPRAWAMGVNNTYPRDFPFTTYVYCGPDGVDGVSDFSRATGRGDSTRTDSPDCGKTSSVVSGGFDLEPYSDRLNGLTIFDTSRAGDGWRAVAGQQFSGSGIVESFAYCSDWVG